MDNQCSLIRYIKSGTPLYQEWNKDDTQILLYTGHLPPPDGWEYTMGTVLQAIGINAGPFCIEARYARGAWRVIEVHARLGEDPRLVPLLPEQPLHVISRAFEKGGA
jgi:hypothetical protein